MIASFRRVPEFDRRADMIEATLDCIADLGIQGTTVRAVAAHAGVSNGLIRHHFASEIAAARRGDRREHIVSETWRFAHERAKRASHEHSGLVDA